MNSLFNTVHQLLSVTLTTQNVHKRTVPNSPSVTWVRGAVEATCCCFLPRAWTTLSLQNSSASALGEHWGSQAIRKTAGIAKSPCESGTWSLLQEAIPSAAAFSSTSLCHSSAFTWGPVGSVPFAGTVPHHPQLWTSQEMSLCPISCSCHGN